MTRFVYAVDNSLRAEGVDQLVGFITVAADSPEEGRIELTRSGQLRLDEIAHVGQEVPE